MVEQTRRTHHAVSIQAGPGEVDAGSPLDGNLRIRDGAVRVLGRQLAQIGDQMDQEWAARGSTGPPAPLLLLRPAQILTRTIYRDIQSHLSDFQHLFAATKAWMESTSPGKETHRPKASSARACSLKAAPFPNWTTGGAVIVMVAALSVCGVLWIDAKA